jgi:hypothetical protein
LINTFKPSVLLSSASLVFTALLPVASWAAVDNQVPSCYNIQGLDQKPPKIDKELFLLIDQTTPLDDELKRSVLSNVGQVAVPGSKFVVGKFSSFGQGRYFEILAAGAIEPGLTQDKRDSIGKKPLAEFDSCLTKQADYARKLVAGSIRKAFEGISPSLNRSDIMDSFKRLSDRIRTSEAKDKLVFLVSDMIENSSVTSFYAKNTVREIDPKKEFQLSTDHEVLPNTGAARIYVLGAGLIQAPNQSKSQNSEVYREPQKMIALRKFWEMYFSAGGATLEEFGAPALVRPLGWATPLLLGERK